MNDEYGVMHKLDNQQITRDHRNLFKKIKIYK